MSKEKIVFKEAVELFVNAIVPDIMSEKEVPKVNFLFPPSAFKLFYYIHKNPFIKSNSLTPNIEKEDIKRLLPSNQSDPNCPTIIIKDPILFFQLLTDITNEWLNEKDKYFGYGSARTLFLRGIRRIWLRMSPSDFNNIEEFLHNQLLFLKSNIFDEYIKKNIKVSTYLDYSIIASKEENETWYETNDHMSYILTDNNEMHSLPNIHFATKEENGNTICYIYAIQNPNLKHESKKIARSLYKLNAGIENPNVSVSSLLALHTFITMLEEKGIKNIRIPCLQVLSYRYHELLSKEQKENFPRRWGPTTFSMFHNLTTKEKERFIKELKAAQTWYNHIVDKEDFISKTKTEGLFNLFYRIEEQFKNIKVLNTPFIEDEYLNIEITPLKNLIKK